jgi:hypothetical protein
MNAAIQSPRMMCLGPIEILRYGLAGILLLLSGIWELSVAIVKWTLFVLMWTVIVATLMCSVLVLLFCGGPLGIGFLIVVAIAAIRWCLSENY